MGAWRAARLLTGGAGCWLGASFAGKAQLQGPARRPSPAGSREEFGDRAGRGRRAPAVCTYAVPALRQATAGGQCPTVCLNAGYGGGRRCKCAQCPDTHITCDTWGRTRFGCIKRRRAVAVTLYDKPADDA